jgi:fluoride exporter
MRLLLLVAAGGAIGSAARHLVNVASLLLLGPGFPWATLTVNLAGSLLMGVVAAACDPLLGGSPAMRSFLATGILGGFTTFSAFSLDVVQLIERQQSLAATLYVVSSFVLSVGALVTGLTLTRWMLK